MATALQRGFGRAADLGKTWNCNTQRRVLGPCEQYTSIMYAEARSHHRHVARLERDGRKRAGLARRRRRGGDATQGLFVVGRSMQVPLLLPL